MRFERVYPVNLWIRGKSKSKGKLEEDLKQRRPDIFVTEIEEVEGFSQEGISFYKITGYSTNPGVK
jgi:hypothetical protein